MAMLNNQMVDSISHKNLGESHIIIIESPWPQGLETSLPLALLSQGTGWAHQVAVPQRQGIVPVLGELVWWCHGHPIIGKYMEISWLYYIIY